MTDQPKPKKNGPVLGVIIAVVIILAGLGVYSHYRQSSAVASMAQQSAQNTSETLLPTPKTVSPFTLTDDEGQTFANENLKGHWGLVFFGFTRCGDVCPTTLTELNKMYTQLEQTLTAEQLPQVVFVSVDPDRDTADVLHRYVKNYNPHFIGASGSADNLSIFVKDLGLYYSKKPRAGSNDYGMDHSSQIYVFNPDGNWAGILTYPQSADQLISNYKALIHA